MPNFSSLGDTLSFFTVVVALIGCIFFLKEQKSKVADGQTSVDLFKGKELLLVWIFCLLFPIINGTVLYYGLKKKLPQKAKQANKISWLALVVVLVFKYFFDMYVLGGNY
ncbi:MAG: hypothetical protein HY569_01120 [Candidatus Magasanikbacteria bacterium]|nr:hypothetical protein [Candidatus Magasanikbacteria bacterium]